MCLAMPMEVLSVNGNKAVISAGGSREEISLEAVHDMPEVGDYVIAHAGCALHTMGREAAAASLKAWEAMFATPE
jgi:hydrogenase expression/formation protein HypC